MTRKLKMRFKHMREKFFFYRQVRRMCGGQIIKPEPGPVQSRELALATSAMSDKDIERMIDPDIYFRSAYRWMRLSLEILEKNRFDLRSAFTVLEFGTGSARLLRLLRCIPDANLIGTDMNPICVEWCRQNISGAEFYQNEKQPPLAFAKNSSIDLIFACAGELS